MLAALLLLSACTRVPYMNEAREHPAPDRDRFTRIASGGRDPNMVVLLAFSGGGTRAAAFAYGVLQELAATRVVSSRGEQRLLDEVDVISSVSGGSFTSAYFGLFGDRIFEDFEEAFLRVPLQHQLKVALFRPRHWPSLSSRAYGRSDMAAEYYYADMYEHKTFGDLFQRPGAPLTIINSTDIVTGTRIPFTDLFFDAICSDLDSFPITRAIAASSAVPGLATPITLRNRAGSCGYEPPGWVQNPPPALTSPLGHAEGKALGAYLDAAERPWLQLVDGGISDNLGLRAFYTPFSLAQDVEAVFEKLGHKNVQQVLIISVNAATHRIPEWGGESKPPRVFKVLSETSNVMMSRYTADTVHIVETSYAVWARSRTRAGKAVDFEFVEVSFAGVEDPVEREKLNNTMTSLELEDEEIDRLIAAGRLVLRNAPEFRTFVQRNRGSLAAGL